MKQLLRLFFILLAINLFCLPIQAQTSCAPIKGLIAYYPFEEAAGATTRDASGQGATGNLSGGTWQPAGGFDGKGAIALVGTDYIDIPLAWRQPATFSVSFWLKPTRLFDYGQGTTAVMSGGNLGWGAFTFHSTGIGGIYVGTDVATRIYIPYGNPVGLNNWQNFLFTFDNGVGSIYKNGQLLASKAGMTLPQDWTGLRLGISGDEVYDDLRVYDRALTSQEAEEVYGCYVSPKCTVRVSVTPTTTTTPAGKATALQAASNVAGSALYFDGVDDYVQILDKEEPRVPALTKVTNNFTMEAWIWPTATHELDDPSYRYGGTSGQRFAIFPQYGGSFDQDGGNHVGAGISVGTNGVSVYEHTADYMPAVLIHPQTLTGWTHVAVVYQNGAPSLYVNGVLVRTGQPSARAYVHPSLGCGAGYGYFQGSIDEFRIWDRVRTKEEIKADFGRTVVSTTPGLVGYWRFDEASGGRVADASSARNTGRLVNGVAWQTTSPAPIASNDIRWTPAANLNASTGPEVVARPTKTTTYTVTAAGPDGGNSASMPILTDNPLTFQQLSGITNTAGQYQAANDNGFFTHNATPAQKLGVGEDGLIYFKYLAGNTGSILGFCSTSAFNTFQDFSLGIWITDPNSQGVQQLNIMANGQGYAATTGGQLVSLTDQHLYGIRRTAGIYTLERSTDNGATWTSIQQIGSGNTEVFVALTLNSGSIVSNVNIKKQASSSTTNSSGCTASDFVTITIDTTNLPPDNPSENRERNWTLERSFDGEDNEVAASKQFLDGLGRPTQAQARNAATQQVFATQTVYNSGGQPVVQTLAAPINNQSFNYRKGFITAGSDEFGPVQFEGTRASAPAAVDAVTPGTLGYYFSELNAQEPLTPITSYPYSLIEPYEGPLGGTRRAAGPGDELRMGKGHEAKGRDFPLRKEFDNYLSLRPQFVPGSPMPTLEYQGMKSVSVNVDGRESIVVTNKEGQAIISCLSGAQYPSVPVAGYLSAEPTNTFDPNAPMYQDVHLSAGSAQPVIFKGGGSVRVIDLLTDVSYDYPVTASTTSVTPAVGAYPYQVSTTETIVTLPPGFYRFVSLTGTQYTAYEAHYGDFSYTYYDDAGRVVASIAPQGTAEILPATAVYRIRASKSGVLITSRGMFSDDQYYAPDPGNTYATNDVIAGTTDQALYQHERYGTNGVGSTGQFAYALPLANGTYTVILHFAELYWDKVGQRVFNVSLENALMLSQYDIVQKVGPRTATTETFTVNVRDGVLNVDFTSAIPGGVDLPKVCALEVLTAPVPTSGAGLHYVTRNTYDTSGRLLATESNDEGRSEYVYAQDGRIRFSQSALQRKIGRFSYSNYDEVGRVVESGEYTPGLQFESHSATASATTGGILQEAENAEFRDSGTSTAASASGASNGAVVTSLFSVGDYVEFSIPLAAGQTGEYELQIGYAAGLGNTRNMSLIVNGNRAAAQQLVFTPTGSWDQAIGIVHTAALLQGGQTNKIRIEFTNQDNGSVNLDYLRAIPSSSNTLFTSGLKQEAESANYINNNNNQPSVVSSASGGQSVGWLSSPGTGVNFSLIAPQAGSYTLLLRYATGGWSPQTMSLVVNGAPARQLSLPGSGYWTVFSTYVTTTTLQAGTNTIQVVYGPADNGYVDLDFLQADGQFVSAPPAQSIFSVLEDRTRSGGLDVSRCAQRNQVWYDLPFDGTAGSQGTDNQLNGRTQEFVLGAVAKTQNENVTTWYSYDELGRVTWVVQDIKGVGVKTLDYKYDFSGNVLEVAYQKGQADAFYHSYGYDAAQRLTTVYTSPDGSTQTLQAEYSYYLHGPLKRVQVAGDLQGVDYTYTLQGALKAINHINQTLEPGHDAPATNGVQKDLFALTLDYFSGDYRSKAISAPSLLAGGPTAPTRYDGTIQGAAWRTAASTDLHRVAYTYDEKSQLQDSQYGQWQRPKNSNSYVLNNASTSALREGGISYDANGNIQSLQRTDQKGATTDNFSYSYKPNTNQLAAVHTGSQSVATVLDYDYDELGQMTRQGDEQGQRYFTYDVTGKTTGVYLKPDYTQPLVEYAYDDRGFRVRQTVYPATGGPTHVTTYVRDVAGNLLALYEQETATSPAVRSEVPLYGSGRLGTLAHLNNGTDDYRYELNDHLGDARVVFHRPTTAIDVETMELSGVPSRAAFLNDDRYRVPADNAPSGQYVARLTDNQAPGQELKRVLAVTRGDTITFSALAQWKQNAATGSGATPYVLVGAAAGVNALSQRGPEGQRVYGTTNSNWLSLLAVGLGFTLGQRTPTSLGSTALEGWIKYRVLDAQGNPMRDGQGQELKGVDYLLGTGKWEYLQTGVRVPQDGTLEVMAGTSGTGEAVYFDNLRVEQTGGLIVQEQHQYAYGASLPGLSYTVGNRRYRYGYQGQYAEHDSLTGFDSFELRLYNSRIGRWMNYDPEGQFDSPYVGMGNDPASGIDPDGGFAGPGQPFISTISNGTGLVKGIGGIAINWSALSPIASSIGKGLANAGPYALQTAISVAKAYPRYVNATGDGMVRAAKGAGSYAAGFTPFSDRDSWQETKQGLSSINPLVPQGRENLGNLAFNVVGKGADFFNPSSSMTAEERGDILGGISFDILLTKGMGSAAGGAGRFLNSAWKGNAALGSSIGPLRQWIRTGNTFSRAGQFPTVGIKWGASPINNGRFIRQIGNPKLQILNQQFRRMKIPINSWRTADPGHLHLWKR